MKIVKYTAAFSSYTNFCKSKHGGGSFLLHAKHIRRHRHQNNTYVFSLIRFVDLQNARTFANTVRKTARTFANTVQKIVVISEPLNRRPHLREPNDWLPKAFLNLDQFVACIDAPVAISEQNSAKPNFGHRWYPCQQIL